MNEFNTNDVSVKNEGAGYFKSSMLSKPVIMAVAFLITLTSFSMASPTFSRYVMDDVLHNFIFNSAPTTVVNVNPIAGITTVGETLTAGTPIPANAQVTYQWMSATAVGGTYQAIEGATVSTYTLTATEYNKYLKVRVTGAGECTGSALSSASTQVTAAKLTSMAPIIGTTKIGSTLTAGLIIPSGATATYQWYYTNNGTTFTTIPAATNSTFVIPTGYNNRFLYVIAKGTGPYTGTVAAITSDPVVATTTTITGIEAPSGVCKAGYTLTAGDLSPYGANATYQWQKCLTPNGTFTNIAGAVSSTYTLAASDVGYYFKVLATGSGNYTGVVSSPVMGPVTTATLTEVGNINGTMAVGEILTSGMVSPFGATFTYQWQRATSPYSGYEDISGATNSTYLLQQSDSGYYIRVAALGTGVYTNTMYSDCKGPVQEDPASIIPLSSIGTIGGTLMVGSEIFAGDVNPAAATVTYQWKRATAAGGVYNNITGATSKNYVLTANDYNYYFKVEGTGVGNYSGTKLSAEAGPVLACPITSIGAILGTTVVGQELTAGLVLPVGATVNYQWQSATTITGTYYNLNGSVNSPTYTCGTAAVNRFVRVVVTGKGAYTGTVTSATTATKVRAASSPATTVTAIGVIKGAVPGMKEGTVLTAGTLTPVASTVTYQWAKCLTTNGAFINIVGANQSSYTVKKSDAGYYIRVMAIGNGYYTGTVFSSPTTVKVEKLSIQSIGTITGSLLSGETITAGQLDPIDATVTYQWYRSDAKNTAYGTYSPVSGATLATYLLGENDVGHYFKVLVTGMGAYNDVFESDITARVESSDSSISITNIGAIGGTNISVGAIITAGELGPSGATASYQWQRSSTIGGTPLDIPGATGSTYALTEADYDYYFRVKATGTGKYKGVVYSPVRGRVGKGKITSVGDIIGTAANGQTITAGLVLPVGATVTYQWQRTGLADMLYANITGATSSTYTISSQQNRFIRLVVTGTGKFEGIATSNPTPNRVINTAPTPITSIGPTAGTPSVGNTLNAGVLNPVDATASYQWYKAPRLSGPFIAIDGATNRTYLLKVSDYDNYVKVEASGTGKYSGRVSNAAIGRIASTEITGVGEISGTLKVGNTLTAGTVSPLDATVYYDWQSSSNPYSGFTSVLTTLSNKYNIGSEDNGKYIRVVVQGSGGYTGSAPSTAIGPVLPEDAQTINLSSIGVISGTNQVGKTLTAGVLSPAAATATYQWQRCSSVTGTYVNIEGATSNTYTLTADDWNNYIRVVATGNGSYTSIVNATTAGKTTPAQLVRISDIEGPGILRATLKAGTVFPLEATVNYQWYRDNTAINGATSKTYITVASDLYCDISVMATGYGAYTGTATSKYMYIDTSVLGNLTGVTISGEVEMGKTLSVSLLEPSGATAAYQWQRSRDYFGTYEDIYGAVDQTYVPTRSDYNYFIRVKASASGDYSGIVYSYPTSVAVPAIPIDLISDITGIPKSGHMLHAGTVSPAGATVEYQWVRSETPDGQMFNIADATDIVYTPTAEDVGWYIRVYTGGLGIYEGYGWSEAFGPIQPNPLTSIGDIIGMPQIGEILQVGDLSPILATATYQWKRCLTTNGAFENITGADTETYMPTDEDLGYYIRVDATGSGYYSETVQSESVGPVTQAAMNFMMLEMDMELPLLDEDFLTVPESGPAITIETPKESTSEPAINTGGETDSKHTINTGQGNTSEPAVSTNTDKDTDTNAGEKATTEPDKEDAESSKEAALEPEPPDSGETPEGPTGGSQGATIGTATDTLKGLSILAIRSFKDSFSTLGWLAKNETREAFGYTSQKLFAIYQNQCIYNFIRKGATL